MIFNIAAQPHVQRSGQRATADPAPRMRCHRPRHPRTCALHTQIAINARRNETMNETRAKYYQPATLLYCPTPGNGRGGCSRP